jgi:hypothetical protein
MSSRTTGPPRGGGAGRAGSGAPARVLGADRAGSGARVLGAVLLVLGALVGSEERGARGCCPSRPSLSWPPGARKVRTLGDGGAWLAVGATRVPPGSGVASSAGAANAAGAVHIVASSARAAPAARVRDRIVGSSGGDAPAGEYRWGGVSPAYPPGIRLAFPS